jgi:hypothetical protein
MPTTSTKRTLRIGLLAGLLSLSAGLVQAQFIRFTINLPPSFELADRGTPPQIIEPIESSNRTVGEMAGLRWMEIRTAENVDIIVEIKFANKGMGSLNCYFLNDGTTNFGNAALLARGSNSLVMHHGNQTIKNLPGNLKYLSAWLGMPAKQGGTLTITYP